jgi:hypothetical protein
VSGGEGDDRISLLNNDVDHVSCGPGNDTVFVDAGDVVASDCESVRR